MSRSINDSVQLLTETLGNCKTALTEKQVADVDNIKISDVDEKIAEITAGGSGTEIDLSDIWDLNDGWGILIIFSDIHTENIINSFYINDVKRDESFCVLAKNTNITNDLNYIFAVVVKDTDPETLKIEITTEYDGSQTLYTLKNVNKPNKKIMFINAQFEYS